MNRVELHTEADAELFEAAFYLDGARAGYGDKFLDDVSAAFERIARFPYVVQRIGRVSKLTLTSFEYDIIYRVEKRRIFVIAIAHHSRRRLYWRSRLR